MKHIKFYSMVTVVLLAFVYSQHAGAKQNANQFLISQFNLTENPQPEDDDQEDTNGGDDQCELMFPFCEANLG